MIFKRKYLYLVLIMYIFSGCSTTMPAISEYRITTDLDSSKFMQEGCRNKSLKVAQAFSSNKLMTQNMNYAQGEYKQFVFTQAQWAESPNRAVTNEILSYISETKLFKNVQVSKSRSSSGLVLETNIEDFMQYFTQDAKASYANVAITLTLIDTKTNRVTATKSFSKKVVVESMDAQGGVVALNSALKVVVTEGGEWLGGICQ